MKQTGYGTYLPGWEYIPDGEPHVFGDRIYIFGSHDRFGGASFCLNDYVCWSAPKDSLTDWRYEGVIYCKDQDPDNPDGKKTMYAPDVTRGPDGRYYLYYCFADYDKTGVAVCDTPAGRYEFLGHLKDRDGNEVGMRPGDYRPFDPGILTDDDGGVHLYTGQGPLRRADDSSEDFLHRMVTKLFLTVPLRERHGAWYMELEPDMVTIKTEPVRLLPDLSDSEGSVFEGHEFFEANSIRKFNGKYYFIYSSVRSHELCYAVSDRPDGGFVYGGTLISNGDIGLGEDVKTGFNGGPSRIAKNYTGNTHGSVEKIGEDYYVFYHRQTNRHMFSRQACVEKTFMEPDGSFKQREMTCTGFYGEVLPGEGDYEARIACNLWSREGCVASAHPAVQNKKHPAFTQDTPDGEGGVQYIENMRDGATAGFKYFDLSGTKEIIVTLRGPGDGALNVYDGEEGELICTIGLSPSKDWHSYTCGISKELKAKSALFFTYSGSKYKDFLSFSLK